MMKKTLLFAYNLLVLSVAFAQEQITDFENIAFKSPHGVQFLDTLNKRILVYVTQSELRQQQSLWSSDGTAANTKIMKDQFGESASSYYGQTAKVKDFRYLKGQHVWGTDGLKLERIVSNSDSLSSLQEFNNKPLLIFRRNETIGNQGYNFLTFTWLDSLNKVSVFDRDVVTYQIIDSTLHYIKYNRQTKFFEIHSRSKDNHYKNVIPISQTVFSIYNLEVFTQNAVDFYFLNTNQGKKLFSKNRNDSTDVSFLKLTDWGSNQFNFPLVLKDEFKKTYFANYNSSINNLKIYALSEQNTLVEQWSIQTLLFFPDANYYYGYGFQVRNMSIIDNKIVFNSTTGSEGINAYYFNVFDIRKNINRKSKNLGVEFGNKFYSMNVTQKDSNTYELDNKIGSIATYNFLADSVINIRTYPYRNSYSADSVFIINQQKILLLENIYNITDGSRKELIPSKQIFDVNAQTNFFAKTFANKLLLWRYNPLLAKSQLWVSNGEKNGNELVATFDGNFSNNIIELNGKIYFYSFGNSNQFSIFESDGTKTGTSRIFKSDGRYKSIPYWIESNTNQILFRSYAQDSVERMIFVENGKVILIENKLKPNFRYEVFKTSKNFYFITSEENRAYYPYLDKKIYCIGKNGFTLIENKTADYVVYDDKLFFTKRIFNIENGLFYFTKGVFGIYFIDKDNKINEFTKDEIDSYSIFGNKLIYKQIIAEGSAPKHTIIDLPTNKVDLVINDFYSYYMQSINGALVLSNYVKILVVKDKQKRKFDVSNLIEVFDKGIVLGESKKLTYYDVLKNEVKSIVSDKTYERPIFAQNYILIPHREDNNTLTWSYWNGLTQKLTSLENSGDFYQADATQAFSDRRVGSQNEIYYWRFDGNNFYKSYQVTPNLNIFISDTDAYFALKYSDETGDELIGLGAESIITYPEIIKGSEGIMLGSAFHFNKQLYVYAFTYTHGWQVWKMAEGDKGTPLTTEEIGEELPNVFPNPVQDYLQINSQQKYHYSVINNIGQEVLRGEISPQGNIDFSKFSTGLYIIQFFDGVKTFSKKIVKY